jgi:predicted Zn-dependent protease
MTRLTLGATALCASLCCGCTSDGSWSMSRLLGWDESPAARSAKMPKADLALAERVETIGRKIIAQNTFTGIEPLFHTVGVPEAVLFHRGAEELIISEGLVKQCRSDSELAAVLSSELAQMMNEKKTARRVGADRDSFTDISVPTNSGLAGGTPVDPARDAERAFLEKQRKQNANRETTDPGKVAGDLMRGAGYDPADLDRMATVLKQSDRGLAIKKQMGGSAPPPRWEW